MLARLAGKPRSVTLIAAIAAAAGLNHRAIAEEVNVSRAATVTASSASESARLAIDDDFASTWRAASGANEWIQLDLGKPISLHKIEQIFADGGVWRFTIEASLDGQAWTTLIDHHAGIAGQVFAQSVSGRFRYVKLTVLQSPEGKQASSRLLSAIGSDNGEDLARLATATASSSLPNYPPAAAIDGRSSSYWVASSASMPQSLTLDLKSPARISEVEQHFKDFDRYAFTIEASKDGEQWTTLLDHRAGARGQTFRATADEAYRLVRLTILSSQSGFWAGSTDFKVIGTRDGTSDAPATAMKNTHWWESTSGVMRYYAKYYHTTLREIADELPSLRARGIGVVELMAPYAGPPDVWAGLGATDNYSIDPSIGTMEHFESLIARCHENGIRLLMFGNVGYARDTAPFFIKAQDDYRNGVESRERDWFHFRKEPGERWHWSDRAGAYFFGFWGDNIPSYNFNNAAWREETKKYIRFWMDKGLDGFAVDAPAVYDGITPEINNECISDVLRTYDTWANPEGARGAGYVRDWHYNSIQDYSLTDWGGDGFSTIIPAINAGDPSALDAIYKGYRDDVNAAGGITQGPPSWEIANVPAEKRLLEIATLTTSGMMFYLHNGKHTLQPQKDVIPTWTPEQQEMLWTLMRVQNSYGALAPAGARVKLATNDDHKFYALKRTDLSGNVKAIVVLNYQPTAEEVVIDLTNTDIATKQTPIDLLRAEPATPIDGTSYAVKLPAYGFAILGVD